MTVQAMLNKRDRHNDNSDKNNDDINNDINWIIITRIMCQVYQDGV